MNLVFFTYCMLTERVDLFWVCCQRIVTTIKKISLKSLTRQWKDGASRNPLLYPWILLHSLWGSRKLSILILNDEYRYSGRSYRYSADILEVV